MPEINRSLLMGNCNTPMEQENEIQQLLTQNQQFLSKYLNQYYLDESTNVVFSNKFG